MTYIMYTAMFLISAYVVYKVLVRKVVIWEPQVALLYKNGKFMRRLPAGSYRFPRFIFDYSVRPVDMRLQTMTLNGQELLTSDNVGIKVSMSVTFKLSNPEKAETEVVRIEEMIYSTVQLALRSAVGTRAVEDMLECRDEIGNEIKQSVIAELEAIGVEVRTVGIKDVMFPGELKKIMNEVIKARKEGQAALEKARGESAALRNLANAARVLENNPGLMNLKVLQTIGEACGNTYVMGLTQDLFQVGNSKAKKQESD